MQTIYNKHTQEELIKRINLLTENHKPQWGKLNVFQMIEHCIKWDEMAFGKLNLKQVFIGRLFGKLALKSMIKDEKPIGRNIGTLPELKTSVVSSSLEPLKKKWGTSVLNYNSLTANHRFVHSFFGTLNKEQTGLLAYKHIDHHLRQFNV